MIGNSILQSESISSEDMAKMESMITPEAITSIISDDLNVTVQGVPLSLAQPIGSGGSKNVYEWETPNGKYAVALPNLIDSPETIASKWKKIVNEANNTRTMREKGFLCNPRFDLVLGKINKVEIPIVLMSPYSELDYTVIDGKNTRNNTPLSYDLDDQEQILTGVAKDISKLVHDRISLKKDSINLAEMEDGQLKIFFNDLGEMEEIPDDFEDNDIVDFYARIVAAIILNNVSQETYKKLSFEDIISIIKSLINAQLHSKTSSTLISI